MQVFFIVAVLAVALAVILVRARSAAVTGPRSRHVRRDSDAAYSGDGSSFGAGSDCGPGGSGDGGSCDGGGGGDGGGGD